MSDKKKSKYGTKPYQNKLSFWDEGIANYLVNTMNPAVKSAENDKYFGVRPKPKTVDEAQTILNNSIYNNYVRWVQSNKPGKFVDFMRKRWAPLKSEGATNDPTNLNMNWAPNVRGYLQKDPDNYKFMKSLNLAKVPIGDTYA